MGCIYPKVAVGMMTHGQVEAWTLGSMLELKEMRPSWLFLPPCVGPLIPGNMAVMMESFLSTDADVLLRIDSDMSWDAGWIPAYERALRFLATSKGESGLWMLGGVACRRQRVAHHVPAVTPLQMEATADPRIYSAWAYDNYVMSRHPVHSASRVGGAFTSPSRLGIPRATRARTTAPA